MEVIFTLFSIKNEKDHKYSLKQKTIVLSQKEPHTSCVELCKTLEGDNFQLIGVHTKTSMF